MNDVVAVVVRIMTKFLLQASTSPRVALVTELADKPGSLMDFLRHFAKNDVNLTHIESRPLTVGTARIYVDFDGIANIPIDCLNQLNNVNDMCMFR